MQTLWPFSHSYEQGSSAAHKRNGPVLAHPSGPCSRTTSGSIRRQKRAPSVVLPSDSTTQIRGGPIPWGPVRNWIVSIVLCVDSTLWWGTIPWESARRDWGIARTFQWREATLTPVSLLEVIFKDPGEHREIISFWQSRHTPDDWQVFTTQLWGWKSFRQLQHHARGQHVKEWEEDLWLARELNVDDEQLVVVSQWRRWEDFWAPKTNDEIGRSLSRICRSGEEAPLKTWVHTDISAWQGSGSAG